MDIQREDTSRLSSFRLVPLEAISSTLVPHTVPVIKLGQDQHLLSAATVAPHTFHPTDMYGITGTQH